MGFRGSKVERNFSVIDGEDEGGSVPLQVYTCACGSEPWFRLVPADSEDGTKTLGLAQILPDGRMTAYSGRWECWSCDTLVPEEFDITARPPLTAVAPPALQL